MSTEEKNSPNGSNSLKFFNLVGCINTRGTCASYRSTSRRFAPKLRPYRHASKRNRPRLELLEMVQAGVLSLYLEPIWARRQILNALAERADSLVRINHCMCGARGAMVEPAVLLSSQGGGVAVNMAVVAPSHVLKRGVRLLPLATSVGLAKKLFSNGASHVPSITSGEAVRAVRVDIPTYGYRGARCR